MAIFHLSAQIISRSSGRTSVAAAAYRSGTKLTCERDGVTHDYSHRTDVVHSEILLPEHAPKRWLDRQTLWNEIEATERSSRASLCREINIALPRELTRDDQIALARRYARSLADEGMVVDWSLHDRDGTNPHLHLMLSLRPSSEGGFGPKTCNAYLVRNAETGEEREATAAELRELGGGWAKVFKYKNGQRLTQDEARAAGLHPTKDRRSKAPVQSTRYLKDWCGNWTGDRSEEERARSSKKLREWRARWADYANDALAASGSTERIDHRSNKARGVEFIPTIHEGPNVAAIERKARARAEREGYQYVPVTDRRRTNQRIQAINKWLRRVAMAITELMLSRLEHAKTKRSKDAAKVNVRKGRMPRRKRPYAPQRGRRVSPSGGMSK